MTIKRASIIIIHCTICPGVRLEQYNRRAHLKQLLFVLMLSGTVTVQYCSVFPGNLFQTNKLHQRAERKP